MGVRLGLRGRLLAIVGAIVVICLGLSSAVLIVQAKTTIDRQATDYSAAVGEKYANLYKSKYEVAADGARSFAQTMEWYVASPNGSNSRDGVNLMLKHLLASNPSMLGVYVGFEPNAFDGKDTNYQTKHSADGADPAELKAYEAEIAADPKLAGQDQTGRFVPYWNRIGGKDNLTPLIFYDKPGDGDYYLLPKSLNHETVIDPYLFYQGSIPGELRRADP